MGSPLNNLKVTFIHPNLGRSGDAESFILNVANVLAEHCSEVTFFTDHVDRSVNILDLERKVKILVQRCWFPSSIAGFFKRYFEYPRMFILAAFFIVKNWKLRKEAVFIDRLPFIIPFIKMWGAKVIYFCQPLNEDEKRALSQLKCLQFSSIERRFKLSLTPYITIVNSHYSASILRQHIPGIHNVQVLYPKLPSHYRNIIDSTARENKTITEVNPKIVLLPTENFIFLVLGSYYPDRNLELSINAFEILKFRLREQDWPSIHLLIVGSFDSSSGECRNKYADLQRLIVHSQVDLKVTLVKMPAIKELAGLLHASHCVIYTPKVSEDFGNYALLAIAAAKPLIVCRDSGTSETVIHRITGYVCQPTPHSIAECMYLTFRINNPMNMGIDGKRHFNTNFTPEIFDRQVVEIFKNGSLESVSTKASLNEAPSGSGTSVPVYKLKQKKRRSLPNIEEGGESTSETDIDSPSTSRTLSEDSIGVSKENVVPLDYNLQLPHTALFRLD